MDVPGWMVRVTPLGAVRLAVTVEGGAAGVRVGLPDKAPETLVPAALSYQMSMLVRANSASFASSDWTSTRLMPGWRATVSAQRALNASQLAGAPLTSTLRVSMAWDVPDRAVVGEVAAG